MTREGRESRRSSFTLQRRDTRAHTRQSSGIKMGSLSRGIEFDRAIENVQVSRVFYAGE
jgi:hypothetical protein